MLNLVQQRSEGCIPWDSKGSCTILWTNVHGSTHGILASSWWTKRWQGLVMACNSFSILELWGVGGIFTCANEKICEDSKKFLLADDK